MVIKVGHKSSNGDLFQDRQLRIAAGKKSEEENQKGPKDGWREGAPRRLLGSRA